MKMKLWVLDVVDAGLEYHLFKNGETPKSAFSDSRFDTWSDCGVITKEEALVFKKFGLLGDEDILKFSEE